MHLIILNALLLYSLLLTQAFPDQAIAPKDIAEKISIDFAGEDDTLAKKLKLLFESTSLDCNAPYWKIIETLDDDINTAKIAARAYGYYHLDIHPNVSKAKNCWFIQVTFIEGPHILIKLIDIQIYGTAKKDIEFIQSLQINQFKEGDHLLHSKYEQQKKKIESIAAKRGYFDGRFIKNQLKINRQENTAYIVLHYDSGIRYRFGELKIEQSSLDDDLFRKFISFQSGDLFNDTMLVSSYQNLSTSGYFSSVDVTPVLEQRHNGNIPISIKAAKRKPKNYTIGVGASSDIGPRLKVTHSNKLINRHGHSHRSELSISPVISNLGFSYKIPDDKPRTDFYDFSTRATHENTDTSTSDTLNFGISNTFLLENDWTRNIALQYSIDDFDVGEDSDTTKLLRPSIGFSKTQSNSILKPTKGYRLNLELTGAHSILLSDIDFYQAQFNGKYIKGISNKIRLLSRFDLGYTETNDFEELPSNLRFFAGGDTSIRGYDYESLGPKDDQGDVTGGEALLVGSIEFDYMLTPKWGTAIFVDSGNAFNDDQIDLNIGAGFGVRWHSPIGPIRTDIGFPIDDPDASDSWRLHFSLGPDL